MNRIECISSMIAKNSISCDIGTDHGKVPIQLEKMKSCKKIIATDISEKSLDKLRQFIEKNEEFQDRIQCRCGDGLQPIRPFEVDHIIITGLGGALIGEMIEGSLEVARSADHMILQANNGRFYLRKLLHKNGFAIEREINLYDKGKYYVLIKTIKNLEKYHYDYEYEYGKYLIDQKDPILKEYLQLEIEKKEGIYHEIKDIRTKSSEERKKELKERIETIEMVLEKMEVEQ
ncbi:MAG: class I SAM-dependent methyltransferase [Tissierellia bacterium]|nr:class I SAM-dependent methyltransferase [Tissierellia bacterium]